MQRSFSNTAATIRAKFVSAIQNARANVQGLTKDLDSSSRNVQTFGTAAAVAGGSPAFAILAASAIAASGAMAAAATVGGVLAASYATVKLATISVCRTTGGRSTSGAVRTRTSHAR